MGNAQSLADLKQQLAEAQTIYNQLVSEAANVQTSNLGSLQKAYAQILDPAQVPPLNVPLLAAFTVLLGLLVGGGLILALEYADHSIHGRGSLESSFEPNNVFVVAARPNRRERRHVAATTWAIPAPGAVGRPGQWAMLLSVATLTAGTLNMRANGHIAAGTTSRRAHDQRHGANADEAPSERR